MEMPSSWNQHTLHPVGERARKYGIGRAITEIEITCDDHVSTLQQKRITSQLNGSFEHVLEQLSFVSCVFVITGCQREIAIKENEETVICDEATALAIKQLTLRG